MSNIKSISGGVVSGYREPNEDVVETLIALLEAAVDGDIQELAFVGGYFDGSMCSDFVGVSQNVLTTYGALSDLTAIYREGMLFDSGEEEDHY